ncbi:hypothetical protein Gohar_015515 [Gossypium harknessii]|uniref:Uncharacterized protein n=1 Tax=Gossypium harknessii TaxID=34285 RepID=A0A7J9G0H3_9ROSI|nr:hypothetical protein [Gossypium harknessii]
MGRMHSRGLVFCSYTLKTILQFYLVLNRF